MGITKVGALWEEEQGEVAVKREERLRCAAG